MNGSLGTVVPTAICGQQNSNSKVDYVHRLNMAYRWTVLTLRQFKDSSVFHGVIYTVKQNAFGLTKDGKLNSIKIKRYPLLKSGLTCCETFLASCSTRTVGSYPG